MTDKLICAWLSRHEPSLNQRHSLRDYHIVHVIRPKHHRFETAGEAWNAVMMTCVQTPDLVVAVLPNLWGVEFVKLARIVAPKTPILKAVMQAPDYTCWSGEWRCWDVEGDELRGYTWTPEDAS